MSWRYFGLWDHDGWLFGHEYVSYQGKSKWTNPKFVVLKMGVLFGPWSSSIDLHLYRKSNKVSTNYLALTVAIVHDDTELAFFGFEDLNKRDNIWMVKCFQQSCLLHSFFLFPLWHASNVYHLHHAHVWVLHAPHKKSLSERSFTEQFDFLVGFKFRSLFDLLHMHMWVNHFW